MPCSNLTISTGLVRHEVELILNNINWANIVEAQRRINSTRMPYDIGRLPGNATVERAIGIYGMNNNMHIFITKRFIPRGYLFLSHRGAQSWHPLI